MICQRIVGDFGTTSCQSAVIVCVHVKGVAPPATAGRARLLEVMRALHVPSQVEVGLKVPLADGALHVSGVVDEFHVLPQVRQVAVDTSALLAGPRVQRVQFSRVRACNKPTELAPLQVRRPGPVSGT